MRYRVRARRVDGWWALDFDVDRRIHSQVRRLDQAADAAADAITLWFADEHGRQVSAEATTSVSSPFSTTISAR